MVLVVSLPPLLYWFGYVQSSVQATKQQGYATLSAVATEFRDRLGAHDRIGLNAGKLAQQQPARLEPYLKSVLKPKTITVGDASDYHLSFDSIGGGLRVHVGAVEHAKLCGSADPCQVSALVPLEDLIPWNVVGTELDGLLVLSESGQLIAQDRRLPRQPLGVAVPLRDGAGRVDVPAILAGRQAESEGGKPSQPQESRGFRGPFDFRDDATIQLGGVEYLAFLQAVSIAVSPVAPGKAAKSEKVFVCGLLDKARVRRSAIALSPQTLILAGALVAFGLFAIPFLKLRFIGERERMAPRDVWLLGASVLSATALLVLVILDAHSMVKLRDRFDGALQQLGDAIVDHLASETDAAVVQLRASAPDVLAESVRTKVRENSGAGAPPAAMCNDKRVEPVVVGSALASSRVFTYPEFEAIFIADLCGNQTKKWMVRTDPTPSISVLEQPYFSPSLTVTADSVVPRNQDFKFQTSITSTTGLLIGVYGMPLGSDPGALGAQVPPAKRSGIAVLATPLASVGSAVVSQPFQFVLVNRRGEVTFQTAQTSFRGERFFDAVTEGSSLERAARTGGRLTESYRYRGRYYRMAARDIPALELTLVTFYDQSVVGTLAARTFSTAAPFVFGIVASMLIGAALSIILFRGSALDWAWPNTDRTSHYFVGGVMCLASAFVLLVLRHYLASKALAAFILLAPAAIMLCLGSGYVTKAVRWAVEKVRPRNAGAPVPREVFAFAFQSFVVMAMLAFVAWPSVIVFNDAFQLHSAAYATDAAKHWQAARTKWHEWNMDRLVNVGDPIKETDCVNEHDLRCTAPSPIYASAQNYRALVDSRTERSLYYNCADLSDDAAACSTGDIPAVPYSVTVGLASALAGMDRTQVQLATTLASFDRSQAGLESEPVLSGIHRSTLGTWGIVGALLLIGAVSLLVRSVARHVLGIEFTHEGVLDNSGQFVNSNGTRWLLLRPSKATLSSMKGTIVVQDLGDAQKPSFTAPAVDTTLQLQGAAARLADPAWRSALLDLLRQPVPGCLVIVSEIEPLHYLTQKVREQCDYLKWLAPTEEKQRAEAEQACAKLREELVNWSTVLRGFRKVRENPPRLSMLTDHAHNESLCNKLADECSHTGPLIDIGTQLLERSDLAMYRWDRIVDFVRDAAEPYYRSIWELSSREERLVLVQLAQAGLINPKRAEIVRHLARRGLVVMNPHFRIMNESFAKFVADAEPQERITEWERSSTGMSWARLGTPLYALAAIVIAILLFTEQAAFTNVLAIATGAAGTIGTLRNLYATAKPPGGSAKAA